MTNHGSPEFAADLRRTDKEACLTLRGEIDVSVIGSLTHALQEAADAGTPRVNVDLSGVSFMDSTGLGALFTAAKAIEARNGRLTVTCPNPAVRRLFEVTALVETLGVQGSSATAQSVA